MKRRRDQLLRWWKGCALSIQTYMHASMPGLPHIKSFSTVSGTVKTDTWASQYFWRQIDWSSSQHFCKERTTLNSGNEIDNTLRARIAHGFIHNDPMDIVEEPGHQATQLQCEYAYQQKRALTIFFNPFFFQARTGNEEPCDLLSCLREILQYLKHFSLPICRFLLFKRRRTALKM